MTATNMNRFDDIEHMPLRVYNRCVLASNLAQDFGQQAVVEYLGQFDEGEQKQIYVMNTAIEVKGQEWVMKTVTKGLEIVDEEVSE